VALAIAVKLFGVPILGIGDESFCASIRCRWRAPISTIPRCSIRRDAAHRDDGRIALMVPRYKADRGGARYAAKLPPAFKTIEPVEQRKTYD
jgi:hypothetical protein